MEAVALGGFEILENFLREQGGRFGSGECDPAIAGDGLQLQGFLKIGEVSPVIGDKALEELGGVELEFQGSGFHYKSGMSIVGSMVRYDAMSF